MSAIEQKRLAYRPVAVRILLIGESAPAGGTFFYNGDSILAQYTCQAFEAAFGLVRSMNEFLAAFKDLGCYLLDLCPTPVNHLDKAPRADARRASIKHLAKALSGMSPDLVVIVMKDIESEVVEALSLAGLDHIPRRALPFPVRKRDAEYVSGLTSLFRQWKAGGFSR